MQTAPLKYLYDLYYASGSKSWVLWLYYRFMRSPLTVKWLFRMKVLSTGELAVYFTQLPVYFSLSTVLLKMVLKDKLRHSPNLKLLEIGVGAFAVLSGCLSRWATQTIDAIDIDPACVASAQKHVELNRVNVRVFQSDLFSNVPACQYDLIFWNLPTEKDLNTYLPDLFKGVPDFMNESAQLIIIYNTKKLPRETVLNILSKYERLNPDEIKTWWWNIHNVLVINKNHSITSEL